MSNLIRFILRYYFTLFFLTLESLSFSLLIYNHEVKRERFVHSANAITANIQLRYSYITQYFNLRLQNRELEEKIVHFMNQSSDAFFTETAQFQTKRDTLYKRHYQYITAHVINNSYAKQKNYLTLDKGKNQGIEAEMVVISSLGVVGIVRDVSNHFSSAISLLNNDLGVSAKLKNTNYYGSISWQTRDYKTTKLSGIPNHVKVSVGDSIVTSGYSALFPNNILIGYVAAIEQEAGSVFFDITVKLAVDFKNLHSVFIVKNLFKEEQQELENKN